MKPAIRQLIINIFSLSILLTITACSKKVPGVEAENQAVNDSTNSGNTSTVELDQEEDFDGTVKQNCNDGDLRALGWSANGRLFAYRDFYYRNGIEINSDFYVTVMDVITDSVMWEYHKDWNIDNSGEDTDPHVSSIEQAWDLAADDVIVPLRNNFGITVSRNAQEHETCNAFPLEFDGEMFIAEAVEDENLESVNVKINVSFRKHVQKNLYSLVEEGFPNSPNDTPSLVGYFINPQRDKIVITFKVLTYVENNGPFLRQSMTGCNLTWFKN
jgi:hypothetical protein